MYRQTGTVNRWFLELPVAPVIKITPDAYAMSMAYVDGCQKEIGWLCHVSEIDGEYIIDDCFLPEQEVAGATCEFTESGIASIMTETIQSKGLEYYNQIRCWAHSHVGMPAQPSGQDKQQILKWKENDYFIMLITNKKGEFYAEFYDFKNKVAFNNLSVELYHPDQKDYNRKATEEIKEKVSDLKPPMSKVVVGDQRNISGQMAFIERMSAQHKVIKDKYPEGFKIAADEECVYERPAMTIIPDYFEDTDDEHYERPIPDTDGGWKNGTQEEYKLWSFAQKIYELSINYPDELTYERILKILLLPKSKLFMPGGTAVKELIKIAQQLTDDDRRYIFNHVFNHNKMDADVIAGVQNILQDDEYVNEIRECLNDDLPYDQDLFCNMVLDETLPADDEAIQEILLILPLFLGTSFSGVIKDYDELTEYVENLMLDKGLKKFLGE